MPGVGLGPGVGWLNAILGMLRVRAHVGSSSVLEALKEESRSTRACLVGSFVSWCGKSFGEFFSRFLLRC